MIRSFLTVTLLILCSLVTQAQSIQKLFKQLPLSYTPEITDTAKDSLIRDLAYLFPSNTEEEILMCTYEESEKGCITLRYSFKSWQGGIQVIQIRKFTKNNGDLILVYSKFGGTYRDFQFQALETFDCRNDSLISNNSYGLPRSLDIQLFFKPTDDGEITENAPLSNGVDLIPEKANAVEYFIYPQTEEFEENILTTSIFYTWDGEVFRLVGSE